MVVQATLGRASASQRGQVVTSTANTSGSAGGREPTSRSRSRSVSIRPGQGGIDAAPAAPADRLQAQVRQGGDRLGAQQRIAQLEQRVSAAGEAGVQLGPERVEPHQGGSWHRHGRAA